MRIILVIVLTGFLLPAYTLCKSRVKTGDEVFVEKYLEMVKGKRVGIITNQSGVLQDGRHIVDVLANMPDVKVVALFGPEHGVRGDAPNGKPVADSVDQKTGIPVYSLYGKTLKPTPEMLKGIDVLIYDIQDVGVRFFTFISTLDLTLEAAAENHIKYIVLDRPDMLRADLIDGPVLIDSLLSFVGIQPITSIYGMTPGEFATMINNGGMLKGGVKADLTVIRMENYKRDMWHDQTGLKWITPSPNLPDMESVETYPGNVLFEGTNVSEGRGTEHPFENIGAPFIDSQKLVALLKKQNLAGVKFEPIDFTPQPSPSASELKYSGQLCHGVKITIVNRNVFMPVEMATTLIWVIHKLYPDDFKFHDAGFDRLCGTLEVRLELNAGRTPKEISMEWNKGLGEFEKLRAKYLIYN